jgi:hypothetical protein
MIVAALSRPESSEELNMSNGAGIWLDHRRAVVVNYTSAGHRLEKFQSGLRQLLRDNDGNHPRSLFGTKSKGTRSPKPAPAEKADLNVFLEQVADAVRNADSIAICGPGQAKSELRNHLARHKLDDRVVSCEPAERMSDRLIVTHFQKELFPEATRKPAPPLTPKERKSRANSKNPGNTADASRAGSTAPFDAAASPRAPSRKRVTGPAAQKLASESPETRRSVRSGTGRKNAYANMPQARKVR